jgi:hypothetical protein
MRMIFQKIFKTCHFFHRFAAKMLKYFLILARRHLNFHQKLFVKITCIHNNYLSLFIIYFKNEYIGLSATPKEFLADSKMIGSTV